MLVDAAPGAWCARCVEIGIPVVIVVLGVLVVVLALRSVERARARRGELLQQSLATEDPAVVVDPKTGAAVCTVRGFPLRFRFTTRGSGSSAESWTEVEVDLPRNPMALLLRRHQSRDARLIKNELAIDIQLGDPVLDVKYLVEGAPLGVVQRVFTPAVQQRVLDLDLDEIESRPSGIQIARRGWREDPGAVQALVDFAVGVAAGVGPAAAEATKAEAPLPESAYRGSAVSPQDQERWQAAQRQVAARQADEVERLEAMRQRRAASEKTRALVVGLVVTLLFALVIALTFGR